MSKLVIKIILGLTFALSTTFSMAYERVSSANAPQPFVKNQFAFFELGYVNVINSPFYKADSSVLTGSYGVEIKHNLMFWFNGGAFVGTNRPSNNAERKIFIASIAEGLAGYSFKVTDIFNINFGFGFGFSIENAFYNPLLENKNSEFSARTYKNLVLKIPFRTEFMFKIMDNFEAGLIPFYAVRWQSDFLKRSQWNLSHEVGVLASFRTIF